MSYPSMGPSLFDYFVAPIREDVILEIELLILTFITGIEDAATFLEYHCFTSNQTGNTVLLSIATAGFSSNLNTSVSNMSISLSMFILGSWINGQIGNYLGRRRRYWLVVTSFLQTAMVFIAAGLQFGILDPEYSPAFSSNAAGLGALAFLAFSSGGQVAMVRSLGIMEITTANATSTYVELLIDTQLYKLHNRSRNRRLLFLLCLCIGSFAGSFVFYRCGGPISLLICAAGKLAITIAMSLNREIIEKDEKQNYSTDSFTMV
jgi:uncharacterized membrane protein YoaK (UPF0700 family)